MNKVIIYTKDICGYCDRAKNFFKSKNINYTEYNINKEPKKFNEMIKISNGMKTLPQIFINKMHIGGYDDLKSIINTGKFDKIIK
ncbi:MAG: Glutaredoxin-3 [Alphaproteobacteria bacterium MarineAlpha5_Bin9]|nr:MAG: Glutaredoxin-3 [Alphaproteobacteria bacterium MarineAlpha5_Bin9]|tara:strand:+ start:6244 stop:6498 length:255 start_codon:yes stop_codon:yes gene_type:complete